MFSGGAVQETLFGSGCSAPSIRSVRAVRVDLGQGAWLERLPGLVQGSQALFDDLRHSTAWSGHEREMYGRTVAVPRLLGRPEGPNPMLDALVEQFEARWGWRLDRITLALYRGGNDSVAWHGDRMGTLRDDCIIAVLSLGFPRTFRVRPAGGGRSLSIPLESGDVVAMGGTAQRTHEHAVPKLRDAGPRIAVMFRPAAAPPP